MYQRIAAALVVASGFACGGVESGADVEAGRTTRATGGDCSSCLAELEITSLSPREGDLSRVADSTYSTWGSGSVKLYCDDGSTWDVVDTGLDPSDLEFGFELTSLGLPAVDLESTSLACELQVDDGSSYAEIDVDII